MDAIAEGFITSAGGVLLGWVPQWVWIVLGFWPYILGTLGLLLVAIILHKAYQLGGWAGLTVAVGGLGVSIGYFLGRRAPQHTIEDKPVPKKKKRRRPTILGSLLQNE